MDRYWPIIKKAIAYLIKNGPCTQHDRWEEEPEFTTFTLAAEVEDLLAAADIADENKHAELAQYCRETADYWSDNIERWTYVTGTEMEKQNDVDVDYIRLNSDHNTVANDLGDKTLNLKIIPLAKEKQSCGNRLV